MTKKKKKELNKKKKQVSQINLINQNTQEKNNTAKQIPFFFFLTWAYKILVGPFLFWNAPAQLDKQSSDISAPTWSGLP